MTYGHSMDNTWIWYGPLLSILNPYSVLSSFSYNSIVLYYRIAMYLAEIHRYPIGFSMGMIWLSPIPIAHDL